MEAVRITYHFEDGSWWAETPSDIGFVAGGVTFAEVRQLTTEGLAFATGAPVELDERFDDHARWALQRETAESFSTESHVAISAVARTAGAQAPWTMRIVPAQTTSFGRHMASSAV